jgi:hypothetical protein
VKEVGMRKWGAERLAACSGVVFVALFIVGYLVAGKPPDLRDPNADWITYVGSHHRRLLVGAILLGLSFFAVLWFAGSVAAALRRGGEARLGTVAFGGAVAATGLGLSSTAIQAALAYRIGSEAPSLVKPLAVLATVDVTMVGFPIGVLMGAVTLSAWRSKIFPQWYVLTGGVATLALVVSGGALANKGFYAPDGAYAIITLFVFLAWVLATSALIAVKAPAPGDAPPATATAA